MKYAIPLLLAATLAAPMPAAVASPASAAVPAATATLADTRAALRDLWIGHVFWVRNVVDARFDGDAAAAEAAERQVVANTRALAASIAPFYGQAAADRLFGLLAGHWGAVRAYLDATHAGDAAGADAALRSMLQNADEIATFLGGANPHLPVATLQGLLSAHGAHHAQQIREFKARQFDAEARTWGAMTQHMYVIADALADAIARQFPDRFRAA